MCDIVVVKPLKSPKQLRFLFFSSCKTLLERSLRDIWVNMFCSRSIIASILHVEYENQRKHFKICPLFKFKVLKIILQ